MNDAPLVPLDALVVDEREREQLGKVAASERNGEAAAAVDRLRLSCQGRTISNKRGMRVAMTDLRG